MSIAANVTSLFVRDDSAATALEFALVGPVLLTLVVGLIYACLLLFSLASMQYAVQEGARCASVKTTICTGDSSTVAYTQSAYYGPVISHFHVHERDVWPLGQRLSKFCL